LYWGKVKYLRQIKQQKTCLLEQLNPFPEYPTLHWQSYEPSLSEQLALTWHGSLKHSSMSVKYKDKKNLFWRKVKYFIHMIEWNILLTRTIESISRISNITLTVIRTCVVRTVGINMTRVTQTFINVCKRYTKIRKIRIEER
jgi:hypothetical protein